jgi:hypothetical protein
LFVSFAIRRRTLIQLTTSEGNAMFRTGVITIFMLSLVAGTAVLATQQDYIDELMKLSQLSSSQQYREAISGYKRLAAQPGTPAWLKAGSEYEMAELYATLNDNDNAVAALSRATQLGFDDCLSPRMSEHLGPILNNPKATQALSGMMITEGDFRELVWLKSEVEHAEHDARMMITENINRLDQQFTDIPQAQLPTRPTSSAGVMYWRSQLLLIQRAQREFVKKSDEERMVHAATMGVISGASPSAVLESARRASAIAGARRAEIARRAFLPVSTSSAPKPCSNWATTLR